MQKKYFIIFLTCVSLSCANETRVTNVQTESVVVDSSVDSLADSAYIAYLAPYKTAVEQEMAVVIGFTPDSMRVAAPECTMLNWATEALWYAAKEVCPAQVDIALMNMGGMRCEWPAGQITVGNVFELMPFDNMLVVLTLKGEDVWALCQSFATYGGQGVAGLRMKAVGGQVKEVTIGGKPLNKDQLYTIATSDYLSGGTDHMDALKNHVDCWNSGLLVRDLYVQAVKRDTVRAVVDGRMDIRQ